MVTSFELRPIVEEEDNSSADVVERIELPPVIEQTLIDTVESILNHKLALGALRDGRLRVVMPIAVEQTTEGGKYVVESPELNEFGFGDNLSEAIADLQAAIAELYFTLDEERERLGPDLVQVWSALSKMVRKADATYS